MAELVDTPIERPNTYELLAQRLLGLIASGEIGVGVQIDRKAHV